MTHGDDCHVCGRPRDSAWRSDVDRMLSLLVKRIEGVEETMHEKVGKRIEAVEETMHEVVGGMSNIMDELEVIRRHVCVDTGVQTMNNEVNVQARRVFVATSTPSNAQQCNSQSNVGDAVVDVATPSSPQKPVGPHPVEPLRPSTSRPFVVDLENMSSRSDDNNATGVGKKIMDSPAARVHSNPRQRVVPCVRKSLGWAATAGKEESTGTHGAVTPVPPNPIPYAPKYKDPPGYDQASDFGEADEPSFKPPTLKPRKKGVRCPLTQPLY